MGAQVTHTLVGAMTGVANILLALNASISMERCVSGESKSIDVDKGKKIKT